MRPLGASLFAGHAVIWKTPTRMRPFSTAWDVSIGEMMTIRDLSYSEESLEKLEPFKPALEKALVDCEVW